MVDWWWPRTTYGIRYTDDQGQSWTYANTNLDDVTMTFIRKAANGYYFTADGYPIPKQRPDRCLGR